MIKGIVHEVDHFHFGFRLLLVLFYIFPFDDLEIDLKIEHALEPVSVNGIIGIRCAGGISPPRPWETHATQVVVVDRKPAVMTVIAAFLQFYGKEQVGPLAKVLFRDPVKGIYRRYTLKVKAP